MPLSFIASKLFFIGVLRVRAALSMFVWPAIKGIKYLASSQIRKKRIQAVAATVMVLGGIIILIGPVRGSTQHPRRGGLDPEQSFVRPGTDGFVDGLMAQPGTRIKWGIPRQVL